MNRLILITEGGAHTVEYFHRNRVYPDAIVMETDKFQELAPYLSKDDDILLVIKGLTDFTLRSVYGLVKKLDEHRGGVGRIVIMSNMDLGVIQTPYFRYTGDLFYGTVERVENGHRIPLDSDGKPIVKRPLKLNRGGKAKTSGDVTQNAVMRSYLVYSQRDKRFQIYGRTLKSFVPYDKNAEEEQRLIEVDLYDNGGKRE